MFTSESVVQDAAPESHELPDTVPLLLTLRPSMTQRMLLDGVINNIDESLGRLRAMRTYFLALKWTTQYTETPEGTLFR